MTDSEKLILLAQKPKTSHVLHLILCLISAGLWLPMWFIIGAINQQRCANIDRKIKRG